MKADKLAKELLNYKAGDVYSDIYIEDNKLIVKYDGLHYNFIIAKERTLLGKLMENGKPFKPLKYIRDPK